MMSIVDYFDPHDSDHIVAYDELRTNGSWPEWFYKEIKSNNLSLPSNWHFEITCKMADAWIDRKLSKI